MELSISAFAGLPLLHQYTILMLYLASTEVPVGSISRTVN